MYTYTIKTLLHFTSLAYISATQDEIIKKVNSKRTGYISEAKLQKMVPGPQISGMSYIRQQAGGIPQW